MIDLSIIIPVYNAEKTVNTLLDCVTKSSGEYIFEIIIIDDGSTDNSGKICDEYAAKDNRVKVFHKENGGVSSARNKGIEIASGDYLFFCDSDDSVDISGLISAVNLAKSKNCEIVVSDYKTYNVITGEETVISCGINYDTVLTKKEIKDSMLSRFVSEQTVGLANLWNKIYLRSFIGKNNLLFDENRSHGEDWAFNIKAFENAGRVIATNDMFYTYRLDGSQNYNKYRKKLGYSILNGYEIISDLYKKYFANDSNCSLDFKIVSLGFLERIISFLKMDNLPKCEKKQFVKSAAVKTAMKEVLGIKNAELYKYNISRKNKLVAKLLLFGFIKLPCKIY